MSQGDNKEVVTYDKSKKYSDWSDKILWIYNDREKIVNERGIIITVANKTKMDVKAVFYVKSECLFFSMLNSKEKKKIRNTEWG